MSRDLKAVIEKRMADGEPFTFADLWVRHGHPTHRLADRLIQSWRKRGWIAFVRAGNKTLWSLTDRGKLEARP